MRSFGEPNFLLLEISGVKRIVRVGSLGAVTNLSLAHGQERRFGAAEWTRVVASSGDGSVPFAPRGAPFPEWLQND